MRQTDITGRYRLQFNYYLFIFTESVDVLCTWVESDGTLFGLLVVVGVLDALTDEPQPSMVMKTIHAISAKYIFRLTLCRENLFFIIKI